MTIEQLADLCGLIGVALLAWPAVKGCDYAKTAADVRTLERDIDPAFSAQITKLKNRLQNIKDTWTNREANLLIGGTVFAALSYVLPNLKTILDLF